MRRAKRRFIQQHITSNADTSVRNVGTAAFTTISNVTNMSSQLGPHLPQHAVDVCDALLEVWGRRVEETAKEAKEFIESYVMEPGGEDIKLGRKSAAIVELIYEHAKE